MKFRNFKMVDYVVYGRGSFNQLDEILAPQRKGDAPMIFLVDHFFEDKPLLSRIPLRGNDKVFAADVTYEPKTTYVDALANKLKEEVIILPEMFTTGFSMQPEQFAETMDGETVSWMKHISATKKAIITGSVIIDEGGRFFNRLIWMQPDGKYGYYDKRHLFAYANEDRHYTSGNKRLIASVKGWKINLQICYDLRFPVWGRHHFAATGGQPEFDMLVYVANWPEKRNHAWKTLLQARAIENQCYAIGLNRVGKDGKDNYHSGDSMIVDAMGAVLYTKAHDEDVHTYILHKEEVEEIRTKLPFWKDGDKFMILDA